MERLLTFGDESLFLSARVVLEAEGIRCSSLPAASGDFGGDRLMVDEADYDRAMEVIKSLQDTQFSHGAPRWLQVTLVVTLLAFVLAPLGTCFYMRVIQ